MSIRILSPKSWHSTLYILRGRPGIYLGGENWKNNNEQQELNQHTGNDDDNKDPSLY